MAALARGFQGGRLLRPLAPPLAAALLGCAGVAPLKVDPAQTAAALEARSLADPGLRHFVGSESGGAGVWPPTRLDLDTLTLIALYEQPSLDVTRAAAGTAHAAIGTAGMRPNPMLWLTPEYSTNPGAGISPWLGTVHLDWTIETAGKRQHRIDLSQALASAAARAVGAEAWRVRRTVRAALAQTVASADRLALLDDEAQALGRLVELRRDKVAAGAASRAETVADELTWLALESGRAAAATAAATARAQLATAVGLPAHALDGVTLERDLGSDADPLATLSEVEMRRAALLERADVLGLLDELASREAALQLELARRYPDLVIGGGYQFDEGQNKWSTGIGVVLPVMNQNQGPIAEALAAREQTAARFVAQQAQVIGELDAALAARAGAQRQVERTEALVAEAQRALAQVREARAAGAADRSAELGAEAELARSQRARVDARLALEQALADLEAAVQGPLPALTALRSADRGARSGP